MGKVFAGESPEGASAAVDAAARAAMAAGARGGLLDALAMDGAVRAHAAGRAREALAFFASACVVCALACAAGAWLSASGHPGEAVVAGLIALALAFPAIGLGLRYAAWRKAARRRSVEVDDARAMLDGKKADGAKRRRETASGDSARKPARRRRLSNTACEVLLILAAFVCCSAVIVLAGILQSMVLASPAGHP